MTAPASDSPRRPPPVLTIRRLWLAGAVAAIAMSCFYCSPGGRKQMLLWSADHAKILEDCRALLDETGVEEGHVSFGGRDERLPASIRRLEPSVVVVAPDWVTIEMGGGFDHWGLVAFPDGPLDRAQSICESIIIEEGGREVLPGLLFYDGDM